MVRNGGSKDTYSPYLHFMLGSTASRSLKPMPHGFPGVASSMKRPNSGWKVGTVSSTLRGQHCAFRICSPRRTSHPLAAGQARRHRCWRASHPLPKLSECLPGAARDEPFDSRHQNRPLGIRPLEWVSKRQVIEKEAIAPRRPIAVHLALCPLPSSILQVIAIVC